MNVAAHSNRLRRLHFSQTLIFLSRNTGNNNVLKVSIKVHLRNNFGTKKQPFRMGFIDGFNSASFTRWRSLLSTTPLWLDMKFLRMVVPHVLSNFYYTSDACHPARREHKVRENDKIGRKIASPFGSGTSYRPVFSLLDRGQWYGYRRVLKTEISLSRQNKRHSIDIFRNTEYGTAILSLHNMLTSTMSSYDKIIRLLSFGIDQIEKMQFG